MEKYELFKYMFANHPIQLKMEVTYTNKKLEVVPNIVTDPKKMIIEYLQQLKLEWNLCLMIVIITKDLIQKQGLVHVLFF